MKTNCSGHATTSRLGFTFLELIVVITIISALAMVALDRYYKLLVDVERTSMEHDLGVLRSAIAMQVAGHYVAGNLSELTKLVGSNPMDLLAEKPSNYLGAISADRLAEIERGSWFYDTSSGTLVYLARNGLYFESPLREPARAGFKIFPVYSERGEEGAGQKYLSGLTLRALEPYRWLRPWD